MELTDLPLDLFLAIVAHLSGQTVVLCRRVSQAWKAAFTTKEVSVQLLKDRFPRCRELRLAYLAGNGNISAETASTGSPNTGAGETPKVSEDEEDGPDWAGTFALVARRYHHLRTATPRSITKLRLGTTIASAPQSSLPRYVGVAPWNRHLRLNGRSASFHHPDPSWCYAQDLGLLVYHIHPDDVEDAPRAYVYPWRLLDVETGASAEVAFPHDDERIVRRVRIADGVLLFEWCESVPYYCAYAGDRHRHYVTVLDVVPTTGMAAAMRWDTVPRAEWYVFGMRVNKTDRFLSTHSATHYAVYLWHTDPHHAQRDDSATHDLRQPIEHALVWDMSMSGQQPALVRLLNGAALEFYDVRQQAMARLRALGLDARNLFFVEEEHRWSEAPGVGQLPPRAHSVRSTGVPIIPGPVVMPRKEDGEEVAGDQGAVQGPCWFDSCGANGDVHLSFCTRIDKPASPHFQGGASYGSPGIWNGSLPATGTGAPSFAQEIHSAVHALSTRWPGWAPCYRHEDFPYLTVSEMVDFKAGVRIVARNCFMLETLSLHTRPSLSVRSPSVSSDAAASSLPGTSSSATPAASVGGNTGAPISVAAPSTASRPRAEGGENPSAGRLDTDEWEPNDGGGDEEVHFADEMWEQLLGTGYICGDERWIIGESAKIGGSITIVRF